MEKLINKNGVSLIVATLGINNIQPLLHSLEKQTCQDYECIIVDQSENKKLENIVNQFKNIRYISSDRTGNSHNRNLGIMHASKNILAFPDDDCHYKQDVIENVLKLFNKYPNIVGVSGSWRDNISECVIMSGSKNTYANSFNVWTSATNITIFLKASVVKAVEGYNESFGLGSNIFEGGEETDLLLKVIEKGNKILYEPDITIYHHGSNYTLTNIKKQLGYEESWGALFRKWSYSKYIGNRIIITGIILIIRSYLGAIYQLTKLNYKYSKQYVLKNNARYAGWIKYGEMLREKRYNK